MFNNSVPSVGCLHVFRRAGNGNIKVEVETDYSPCDKDYKDRKGRVLEVSDLNFHWAEFNSPSYVVVCWRRFESHVLPVCGLEVLEMIGLTKVKRLKVFCKNNDRVTDEEMGEMCGEKMVHSTVHQALLYVFVHD